MEGAGLENRTRDNILVPTGYPPLLKDFTKFLKASSQQGAVILHEDMVIHPEVLIEDIHEDMIFQKLECMSSKPVANRAQPSCMETFWLLRKLADSPSRNPSNMSNDLP